MNKAIFLDLDGTLIEDTWYNSKPMELREDVIKEIVKLNHSNGHSFVKLIMTNQSGINRGYHTEKELFKRFIELQSKLTSRNLIIDGIYFCPHRPDENCICRKPKTGMFEEAQKEYGIDFTKSIYFGDKVCDEDTAKKLGCKFIKV